jgi:hypothetical protein
LAAYIKQDPEEDLASRLAGAERWQSIPAAFGGETRLEDARIKTKTKRALRGSLASTLIEVPLQAIHCMCCRDALKNARVLALCLVSWQRMSRARCFVKERGFKPLLRIAPVWDLNNATTESLKIKKVSTTDWRHGLYG